MMIRRSVILSALAMSLTAGVPATRGEAPPTAAPASGYVLNSVQVDASAVAGIEGGRDIQRSRQAIAEDVRGTVTAALRQHDTPGGAPLDLKIVVQSVTLSSAVENVVGGVSQMSGTLTAVNAQNGKPFISGKLIKSEAEGFRVPVGLLAIVTTKNPSDDYRATLAGFAHDIERSLYGKNSRK